MPCFGYGASRIASGGGAKTVKAGSLNPRLERIRSLTFRSRSSSREILGDAAPGLFPGERLPYG